MEARGLWDCERDSNAHMWSKIISVIRHYHNVPFTDYAIRFAFELAVAYGYGYTYGYIYTHMLLQPLQISHSSSCCYLVFLFVLFVFLFAYIFTGYCAVRAIVNVLILLL